MFSGFQSNAFQRNAFQIVGGTDVVQPTPGDSRQHDVYITPYQAVKLRQEKLRKEKTELEKLDSVLKNIEKKKAVVSESKLLAKKKRALELEQKENEYLQEINRLLVVRSDLMRRINEDEGLLILLMAMKRRRLRAA